MTLAIKKPSFCKEKSVEHRGAKLKYISAGIGVPVIFCTGYRNSTGNTTPSKEHLFIAIS